VSATVNNPAKNWLEWTVFAVSLVLVVATLGYLTWEAVADTGGPPDVVVELGSPRPSSAGFMVPVEVRNRGKGTAEDVRVTVVLERAGARSESAELEVAYLPRESRRSGYVTFAGDPGQGRLRAGPIAFEVP
jgi:uncharacterized protein (TIGR02588 family)